MALDLNQNFFSAQYLENKWTELHQILYMESYWQDLSWDCYPSFFTFLPELWPLIYAIILFLFNILRTNGQNFIKFCICIYIDKIYIGIFTHYFSNICTRVMALDLGQNFVSVQYLENKWTEFYQILYMHSYWQDIRWNCYTSFFACLYQSYGPWLTPKFCFCLISWDNWQNFTK